MLRGKVGGISVIRSMIFRRSIFSFFLFIFYSTTVVVLFSQCASTRRNSRFPSSPVSFLPSFQVMIKMDDLDGYPRSRRTNSRELCRELSSRKGIVVDASKNVSRVVLLLLPNFYPHVSFFLSFFGFGFGSKEKRCS